jgi:hypothetical protein
MAMLLTRISFGFIEPSNQAVGSLRGKFKVLDGIDSRIPGCRNSRYGERRQRSCASYE